MSQLLADQPLISVVLPVYNHAAFVRETLHSLLTQTYQNIEVIVVVDGGSTDDSAAIVRAVAAQDARVRLIFTEHTNQWRARNIAINAARGELIAHMDDDDLALPHRFATQVAWLRLHNLDVCGGLTKWFGTSEIILWFPESPEATRVELLFRIAILLPTVLMRAEIAKAYPYDERLTFSDYEHLTRLVSKFRLGNVPGILLHERGHADQFHNKYNADMKQDGREIRERYFKSLFPDASPEQQMRFQHVTRGLPFKTEAALHAAGEWLVELAQVPEPFFRQRMALRWRDVCRRSAQLGLGSYRTYQLFLSQIDANADRNDRGLRLACALRLPANVRAPKIAARAARALRGKAA